MVWVTSRTAATTLRVPARGAAIHQAGQNLADLSPSELADMTVQERIELLKSNIIHYAKDLLQFDVLEIRLLDQQTGRLEPLLAEGMQPEAEARILYARPEHNGVTGFVAATGKSYFCADTTKDPLYLEGCKGAKSSLTVPLMLHEQVIGTFNVESHIGGRTTGPVVTQFEVVPAPGVKVNRIANLDAALELVEAGASRLGTSRGVALIVALKAGA